MAMIITSSVCFAYCIVLCYLPIVLRLLCHLLQDMLTGEKIGLLFCLINWQFMLSNKMECFTFSRIANTVYTRAPVHKYQYLLDAILLYSSS